MRLDLIIPPAFSSGAIADQRTVGLGTTGDAWLASGLPQSLAEHADVTIHDIQHDAPAPDHNDPIVRLAGISAVVSDAVREAIRVGATPVIAGGSCVSLPAVLGGMRQGYGPLPRIGLVWFDAHGDFNTPRTTPSGMLGGMPVAVSAGLCYPVWREAAGLDAPIPTSRIVMVDVRNLDPAERTLIEATDVRIVPVPTRDIANAPFADTIAALVNEVDHLYLHVDADVLDIRYQPNHPTAEPDGPSLEDVQAALEVVLGTGRVRAFGLVSVNPNGPGGEASMASGRALIESAIARWSTVEPVFEAVGA